MNMPEYKEGDQVWLSTKNLNINRPLRKLTKRKIRPYTITCVVSPNAIVKNYHHHLKLMHQSMYLDCIHTSHLPSQYGRECYFPWVGCSGHSVTEESVRVSCGNCTLYVLGEVCDNLMHSLMEQHVWCMRGEEVSLGEMTTVSINNRCRVLHPM